MNKIRDAHFEGERSLFKLKDSEVDGCSFGFGESPLKEGRDLVVANSTFGWKYPLWYGKRLQVESCHFVSEARAGIWYTDDSRFLNLEFESPKMFRKCHNIGLENINFLDGEETFWWNNECNLKNIKSKGDYFAMGCSSLKIDNLQLEGNYPFDGCKDILIENSLLYSKDAFWNSENITIRKCKIVGEYFGWNSKNITLIDCEIESHQGFCYMEGVTLINCSLNNTDLSFEYCSNINADIKSEIDSVKNPISGKISSKGIKETIFDDPSIDPSKTILESK